ncbi:LapA family protein [Oscillatoria salina]|uniref:hypothetical protein n=1 Tax=Oscillatoria salina TaxID=331517 RepID=UPI0013BB9DA1|nr:hypothetical protein [Oscillatoria salina]MBZ8181970.1 LapA family protein [Oscillatoria salina IIICB1]NET89332.1 LapA family protein [Kamptonema sp. SIO1D9]
MSAIQLVLTLLILGGIIVFLLQNWSPVLPLVFFGTQTVALPLAVWILLFAIAGILTSACLQVLNYRPRYKNDAGFREIKSEEPPSPRSPRRETTVSGSRGAEPNSMPPPSPPPQTNTDSDWIDDNDDWDLEEPPAQPTNPTSFKTSQADARFYEVKRQPQNISRTGSVYSYSYRDKEQTSSTPGEQQIVDAKYRVITPPLRENTYESVPEKKIDEEDWGFDEDELEP